MSQRFLHADGINFHGFVQDAKVQDQHSFLCRRGACKGFLLLCGWEVGPCPSPLLKKGQPCSDFGYGFGAPKIVDLQPMSFAVPLSPALKRFPWKDRLETLCWPSFRSLSRGRGLTLSPPPASGHLHPEHGRRYLRRLGAATSTRGTSFSSGVSGSMLGARAQKAEKSRVPSWQNVEEIWPSAGNSNEAKNAVATFFWS